jgi:hypothetical protein
VGVTPGSNNWSQKQPLGGSGRLIYDQISVERNRDCRLEVFGVAPTGRRITSGSARAVATGVPFYSLGGGFDGPVTAGKNADGRLEVFGIGETGAMYHAWQTSAGGSWTGWYSLGDGPYDPFVLAPFSPGVGIYGDGSLFVRIWDYGATRGKSTSSRLAAPGSETGSGPIQRAPGVAHEPPIWNGMNRMEIQ